MKNLYEKFGMEKLINISGLTRQYNELKKECYSTYLNGYRPAQQKNICGLFNIISSLLESKKEIIVFAVDAISYEYFCKEIIPQIKYPDTKMGGPLSSVFPSTSATCWASILTNTLPSEHGIYGTSFTHEQTGFNYIWHRNCFCDRDRIIQNKYKNAKFNLVLTDKNIFQELLNRGYNCYDIGHYFEKCESTPLITRLTKGAIRIQSDFEMADLMENPEIVAEKCIHDIRQILERDKTRKMIWTYIDTDNFIHHYGYKQLTRNFDWEKIFSFWDDYYNEERAFIFLSDHGQIRQKDVCWDVLKESKYCDKLRCNTGGAGRVLYFYPNQGEEEDAIKWIAEIVGNTGKIYNKQELVKYGLLRENARCLERVGDLIAIGYEENFPSTGQDYLFEHGSLSEQEMFVPIVVMA